MTTKKASKKKVAPKKAAPKKAAPKIKAGGGKKPMTSREKILRYTDVVKERGHAGNVLIFGNHRYRMNKLLADHTDAECDRIYKNMDETMKFGAHIRSIEKKKSTVSKRRAVTTTDPKPCECGCGAITRRGSRFLPGHDAKLKSKLRKATKKGNANAKAAAKKELKSRGWA